jgi:thioesterase domain-containing protein
MAQQLQRTGERVALLAVFDTNLAPAEGDPTAETDDAALMLYLLPEPFPLSLEDLRTIPADVRLERVFALAERHGMLPAGFTLEDAARRLEILRTNSFAAWRYAPQPYRGRVTLFRAQESPASTAADLGWKALTRGELVVHPVPGNHMTMMESPCVGDLAGKLAEALEEALFVSEEDPRGEPEAF